MEEEKEEQEEEEGRVHYTTPITSNQPHQPASQQASKPGVRRPRDGEQHEERWVGVAALQSAEERATESQLNTCM